MIVFLSGPDEYRRARARQAIVAAFIETHGVLSAERFDCADPEGVGRCIEYCRMQSMFQPTKLAILENLFVDPAQELVAEIKTVASRSDITILVSERESPPRPLAFLVPSSRSPKKTSAPRATHEKFETLRGKEWHAFVAAEAAARSVVLAPDAQNFLAHLYEGDSWRLATELDKLRGASAEAIARKDLEDTGLETPPGFWEMMTALRSRSLGARLRGVEQVLATKEPAGKIFNIVAYQWPEKIGLMGRYDLAVKSGKLDYEEALVDLAAS